MTAVARATLAVAGMNLTLVQWLAIRELGPLLGSSELVVLLIVTAYFGGMSAGYLIAPSLSRRALAALALATVALHATLPFSARVVAAACHSVNLAGNVPLLAFLGVLLGVSPFYALVLPRLAQELRTSGAAAVPAAYATELGGALAGLALLVAVGPARFPALMVAHFAGLVALTLLICPALWARARWLALAPLAYAALYALADRPSLEVFYGAAFRFRAPRLLASEVTPYARVDIVDDATGAVAPELYLDGVKYYGTASLNRHNLLVTVLPNLAMAARRRPRSVIVGAGSLDGARFVGPVADLTVVELDEAVPRLARAVLQAPRGPLPAFQLEIDDGARWLATRAPATLDVISVDVPMPLSIQTARFHAPGFFSAARTALTTDGVFATSLSGSARRQERTLSAAPLARRVLAGLTRTFPHVAVVTTGGGEQAFAWASGAPLTLEGVDRLARAFVERTGTARHFQVGSIEVLPATAAAELARGYEPVGEADMQLVLATCFRRLVNRYFTR